MKGNNSLKGLRISQHPFIVILDVDLYDQTLHQFARVTRSLAGFVCHILTLRCLSETRYRHGRLNWLLLSSILKGMLRSYIRILVCVNSLHSCISGSCRVAFLSSLQWAQKASLRFCSSLCSVVVFWHQLQSKRGISKFDVFLKRFFLIWHWNHMSLIICNECWRLGRP
jgi:hypothetical protein